MTFLNRVHYQNRRIERIERSVNQLDKKNKRLSFVRLIIFFVGLLGTLISFWINKTVAGSFFLSSTLFFSIVAWFHNRILFAMSKFQLWKTFEADMLARMTINWPELPTEMKFPINNDHPFDQDVNVTGKYSLHRLLNIAITEIGSRRLAEWLLNSTPKIDEVKKRQTIVQELKKRRQFRTRLLLNFRLVNKEQLSGDKVRHWLSKITSSKKLTALFLSGLFLCIVNITLLLWALAGGPAFWGYGLLVYMAFILLNRDIWFHLGDDAAFLDMEFKQAITVFRFLERYSYANTPALEILCKDFKGEQKPTKQLRSFIWLAVLIGLRSNFATAIILNIFFPYDFLCALLLSRKKKHVSEKFEKWLDVVYELDALNCLAQFAANNSAAAFPNFTDEKESTLDVKNLGHPFILPTNRLANNFEISGKAGTVLITGSNMSGKSTFLRTLGINIVLAYAGAPVIASSFSMSPVKLFCCIQVNDSIKDGVSQFYAEVKRLKKLQDELDNADERPIFYLVDEIFKGTNNRERFIGSRSFIKSLMKKQGFGLISTHDLELTHLANIRNLHFREHIKDGKLVFDYVLHDGPCPTTNALKIIKLEGLPLDEDFESETQVKP
jgi:hypothetical protein